MKKDKVRTPRRRRRSISSLAAAAALSAVVLALWLSVMARGPSAGRFESAADQPEQHVAEAAAAGDRVAPVLTADEEREARLHEGPPQVLRLRWPDLPQPGALRALPGTSFDLLVENLSKAPVNVDISLTIDAGTGVATMHQLPQSEVGPGQVARVPIDLDSFPIELAAMQFSGRLHAIARAQIESRRLSETSNGVFFHREVGGGNRVLVYDEDVLRARFGAGDFRGLLDIADEEGVITDRIVAAQTSSTDPATATNPSEGEIYE